MKRCNTNFFFFNGECFNFLWRRRNAWFYSSETRNLQSTELFYCTKKSLVSLTSWSTPQTTLINVWVRNAWNPWESFSLAIYLRKIRSYRYCYASNWYIDSREKKKKKKKTQERNSTLHLVTVHFFKSFIAQPGASNWFRFSFLTSGFVINPATPFFLHLVLVWPDPKHPSTALHMTCRGRELFKSDPYVKSKQKNLPFKSAFWSPSRTDYHHKAMVPEHGHRFYTKQVMYLIYTTWYIVYF